jgi:hypothetical protein
MEQSWPYFRYYPRIGVAGLRNTMKTSVRIATVASGRSEYKPQASSVEPTRSALQFGAWGLLYSNFFFNLYSGGWNPRSTRHCGHIMAYCASPRWLWWWKNRWNDWQGKPKYSEKTWPSAALSTTYPTCCPYANPGRRGGKPVSNRLSYGTAFIF